jgi:hypothetical protein
MLNLRIYSISQVVIFPALALLPARFVIDNFLDRPLYKLDQHLHQTTNLKE